MRMLEAGRHFAPLVNRPALGTTCSERLRQLELPPLGRLIIT